MRKANAIITVLIFVAFIAHTIVGSLMMLGVDAKVTRMLGDFTLVTIAAHTIIGIILTIDTIIKIKKAKASYIKGNEKFWARRITGFLIIGLMVFHMVIFEMGRYNLVDMILMILLVVIIHGHIFINIEPMLISFGVIKYKKVERIIDVVITIVSLVAVVAFVIFYFIGIFS